MRRKGFTFWEVIAALFGFAMIALILFPIFARSRNGRRSPTSVCQSNLKQISLGVSQYTQDYDEKLPLAKNSRLGLTKPDNWVGVLHPYLKSTAIFQCPSDENVGSPDKASYAYNGRLDEQSLENLKSIYSTLVLFEVLSDAGDWTQTGMGPQAVSANERHFDGSNYLFIAGHVKWLKPGQVTNEKPNGKNYTFHVK